MDIFTVIICEIHYERPGKRGVFIEATTDCYGKRQERLYFSNRIWERVKARKCFLETESMDWNYGEYVEGLNDEDYYKKFEFDIKDISNDVLVAEINRRAEKHSFIDKDYISFEVRAICKKNK